jgi:hypothetical protein
MEYSACKMYIAAEARSNILAEKCSISRYALQFAKIRASNTVDKFIERKFLSVFGVTMSGLEKWKGKAVPLRA